MDENPPSIPPTDSGPKRDELNGWNHGVTQPAWTGEVIFGSEFGKGTASLFAEFRILISGRSNISGGLSAEEQEEADQTLYDALIRPEGRVTGGQILLGLRF